MGRLFFAAQVRVHESLHRMIRDPDCALCVSAIRHELTELMNRASLVPRVNWPTMDQVRAARDYHSLRCWHQLIASDVG